MIPSLESLTTATLSLALDAASRRQQAIASNIANAGVEGYQPLQLDFEAQLADARASLQRSGSADARDLALVRLELQPRQGEAGAAARVQLDAEMADMARNAVQYQALAQGLSRHFALLAAAAGDGRK